MREIITLQDPDHPEIKLYSIGTDDLENLRNWKNAHRDSFFFKDIITTDAQLRWYEGYQNREHDCMFVIRHDGLPIGCIAFRRLEDRVDIYNVIMGCKEMGGKGYMGIALRLILAEALKRYPELPLTLMVLKENPALNWYLKNGFTIAREYETYFDLVVATGNLHPDLARHL